MMTPKDEVIIFIEKNLNEQIIAEYKGEPNNFGQWQELAQELADLGILRVNEKFLLERENVRITRKHKYGEYKNVLLTDQEYETLANMQDGLRAIEYLSEYIAYKGYKAKSHYLAIRKWVFDALKEQDLKKSRFSVGDRTTGEQKLEASIPDELLGNVDM